LWKLVRELGGGERGEKGAQTWESEFTRGPVESENHSIPGVSDIMEALLGKGGGMVQNLKKGPSSSGK